MNISNKILSDPINRWVFEHARRDVFLVGGYVRDLIIGRKSTDRDIVVGGDIKKYASDLARQFKGKVITISRFNIFRVITNKGEFIDLTPLGESIESNLQKRDFTINSVAWSPETGLIDPFDGLSDIKNKDMRITGKSSFSDDPLRCLRVFRFAAELNFNIERSTLIGCEKCSGELTRVADERKTDEIIKLLNNTGIASLLDLMLKINVLHELTNLNNKIIKRNIAKIRLLDEFAHEVKVKYTKTYNSLKLKEILDNEISQGMTGRSLIILSILSIDDNSGNIPLKGFRFSNIIKKRIQLIQEVLRNVSGHITQLRLYEMLKLANECSEEVAFILSAMKRDFSMEYLKRAQDLIRFKNENVFDGFDIQRVMNINQGEHIGKIKEEIERRWFLGELKNEREIKSFARSNLT